MRKRTKGLVCCAGMTVAGVVIAAVGLALGGQIYGLQLNAGGFHVSAPALADEQQYMEKDERLEPFDRIEIDVDYAVVKLEQSDHYGIAYGVENAKRISCSNKGKKLVVDRKNSGSVLSFSPDFHWFSVGTDVHRQQEYITVYVPGDAALSDISIHTESGDVSCSDVSARRLKLDAEYGDVALSGVSASDMDISLSSGTLNVDALRGKSCVIKNEYGGVTLTDIQLSGDFQASLESGDFRAKKLYVQDFALAGSYGNVDVEGLTARDASLELESGDGTFTDASFSSWKMQAEYGDVSLAPADDIAAYNYRLKTEYGDISVDGEKVGTSYHTPGQDKMVAITCESGNITVE